MPEEITPAVTPQVGAPVVTPPTPAAPVAPEAPKVVPPWGSDEDFDPAKAWSLIQNLRGDLDKAKPAVARLQQLEDEKLTESQRLERERDDARTQAESSSGEAARLRAAVKYKLTEEDLELLEDVPADKVDARAERIAALRGERIPEPKPKGPHVPSEGRTPETPSIDQQISDAESARNFPLAIALKQKRSAEQRQV